MLSKGWFVEEDLVCGKGSKEVEGDLGSFSPTDACLIEEASRYSFFSPPFCFLGGTRLFFFFFL